MTTSNSLPTVVGPTGLVPQTPQAIRADIISRATSYSPGLTTNLPGILIEDISSTDTAAVVEMDSARVETVDSVTPYGCNEWLLTELGQVYGVDQGLATNTSVQVIFMGTPGYGIAPGFIVSDGIYQYVVQDGGPIESNGQSAPLSCLAAVGGTWAIPAGSVTQVVTPVPSNYTVTCSNPYPGLPGAGAQTASDYRSQVLQAGRAEGLGMPAYTKTQLQNVPGVQKRLIAVQQVPAGGWKVLVGGGDPYAVANAILRGMLDVSTLVPSVLLVSNITTATNAVVTTFLNHGLTTGQTAYVNGITVGMTGINGLPLTVTVLTEKTFSTGQDTSLLGAYVSGGVLTPNYRNNAVSLISYPDVYTVNFVNPPQQLVSITLTWNTTATNFINQSAMQQLGAPALAAYVNSVCVGQPMNLFDLQTTFQQAVASVLSPSLLTRMVFAVSINGVGTPVESGTGVIAGDPESYFYTDPAGLDIVITQG